MSKGHCVKCKSGFKNTKETVVKCCFCDGSVHTKCLEYDDEMLRIINSGKNVKYFCDNCLLYSDNLKSLSILIEKQDDCNRQLKQIMDSSDEIRSELKQFKTSVDQNYDKLDLIKADVDSLLDKSTANVKSEFDKSINVVKKEFSSLWTDVVKNKLEVVTNEVKSVKHTLDVSNDSKERENNMVIFNLKESENAGKDRDVVMFILMSMTENKLNDADILVITRQGHRRDGVLRPVIIKFSNAVSKMLTLKTSFRIQNCLPLRYLTQCELELLSHLAGQSCDNLRRLSIYRPRKSGQLGWPRVGYPDEPAKTTGFETGSWD
ncbi:hypothetical protein HELRODRAFT_175909 [Helobdella robusta]|uniref:Zinc finger PHD-type domain-containing protein n=1 Tax=Helobdella robusta TaxID=6412 RepID=T1F9V3_HELRO|nr:hypothetical protein HELRODRAFT_175909 [Helobdella robusta]ESO00469.1 hypothetical protein HELRODRAFT_175909 [Helobdella robusta]